MSKRNIIRAWKDSSYRNTLSEAERAALPPNPAGAIEIPDEDLGKIAAGSWRTIGCDPDYGTIACPSLNCATKWCTISGPDCRPPYLPQ
jgi:mersacidin/lichenicidin family type 2 lantibiotic